MPTPLINHILIGCPGCGKSTFATKLNQLYPTAKIVSTDRIRTELFGDEGIQGNWSIIEEKVIEQIRESIQAGQPIIYDATNAKKVWRVALLKQLAVLSLENDNHEVQWVGWYLQTPLEVCQAWNKQRNRRVPEIVVEELFYSLQDNPPDESEGFAVVNWVDVSDD